MVGLLPQSFGKGTHAFSCFFEISIAWRQAQALLISSQRLGVLLLEKQNAGDLVERDAIFWILRFDTLERSKSVVIAAFPKSGHVPGLCRIRLEKEQ